METNRLQLGIAILDNLAIAIGAYPYEQGKVQLYDPTGKLVDAEAKSQLGSIQAGLQWKVLEEVTLGVEGIYIIDELEASYGSIAYGVPSQADDFHIKYLAFGASWQILENTLLAADWRWGEIKGQSSAITPGTEFVQDVDRRHFGVEHKPLGRVAWYQAAQRSMAGTGYDRPDILTCNLSGGAGFLHFPIEPFHL